MDHEYVSLAFTALCVLGLVTFGFLVTRRQNAQEAGDALRQLYRNREVTKLRLWLGARGCELVFVIHNREYVASKRAGWLGIERLPLPTSFKAFSWRQIERGARLLGADGNDFRITYASPECGAGLDEEWELEPRTELWADHAQEAEEPAFAN